MNREFIGADIENFEKIPLKERMAFQVFLIQLILGEKPAEKTDLEWNEEELKWAEVYAKTVSDIIDNKENKEIRDLIMKGEYKEASDLVIKMLKEEKKMAA